MTQLSRKIAVQPMPPKTRKFQRPLGEKRYRKLFIIATEGDKTEPQYFSIFKRLTSDAHVICLPGGHASSPPQVLKRMQNYLKEENPLSPYEAWLIVDKDDWSNEQLTQLRKWERQHDNRGLAVSNPKFEYWLLLHFESGSNIKSKRECSDRLKQHLPDYKKNINSRKITADRITAAIGRAKNRDNTTDEDWLPTFGSTTVYKLVKKIIPD